MRKLFGLLVLVLALALCCTGALAWDTYSYEGQYFCSGCNETKLGRFTYIQFETYHNLSFYCNLHEVTVTNEEPHSFDSDADPTCNACGYTREVAEHVHVWSSEWSGNNWYHWHNCTADGCDLPSNLGEGKDGFGSHTLREDHTHMNDDGTHIGTCTVCGKADALNHLYTTSWKYDDTHHWRECGCGVKEVEGEHDFDNDDDLTCNEDGCGYTREVAGHVHVWSSEWSGNNWFHWHDCTADGCDLPSHLGEGKEGFGHHTLGEGHTHDSDNGVHKGTCTVCGKTDAVNRLYTVSWKYDDTHHWRECGCGAKESQLAGEHRFDNDDDLTCNEDGCGYTRGGAHEHYGGTATCTEQAVCTGCGESYGEVDPDAHDWGKWESRGTVKAVGHVRRCTRDLRNHYEEEEHTGGSATCTDATTCTTCHEPYYDRSNHGNNETTDWMPMSNGTHHYKMCKGCGTNQSIAPHDFDNDADPKCDTCGYTREVAHEHSGGTATCTEQAICTGCGRPYGDVDPNAHNWGEWEYKDVLNVVGHVRYCKWKRYHQEEGKHTGGNPTCTVQDRCDVCYGPYYDMSNHGDHGTSEWKVYSDTYHYHTCLGCGNNILTVEHVFDSDIDPKCDTCGYTREVAHEHYGGTATCTEQAVCEGCGESYGEALDHLPGAEATCTTAQVCTREGCGEVLQAAFGHSAVTIEQPAPDCVHASFTNYDECCVCGEILTERKELAPLGHDWVATVIAPTCTEGGYTLHVCKRCGNGYTDTPTEARNHWYGLWSPVDEEQHHADCLRADCEHDKTVDCAWWEIKTDNAQLLVCPVCGDSAVGQFEAIRGAKVKPVDVGAVPAWGEVIVRGAAKPVEGVEFAFTAAYEFAGLVQPFTGAVQFTVPLDEAIAANCLLMRVDAEGLTEMAFTYEDGELTFETDRAAVYLLVTK